MTDFAFRSVRLCVAAALLVGSLGLAPVAAVAQGSRPEAQPVQQNVPAVPAPAMQVMLLQSTFAALNQANLTGDYSVFLKLAAAPFRQINDQQSMASGFRGFRENGIDFAPVVLFPPRWTAAPVVENGMFRMVGVFDTEPQQVTFDLGYLQEGGRWKIAAISVGLNAPKQAARAGGVQ